ncbi:hypothetical protein RvY_14330 [Ramazzottius varieornatus]|uniref:Uncharacterized protein n=1 Tax=Ramazzottius varieornatus TaxID=947166 RepID=A0A1D1VQW7_RAMVA|nr:hypothetical protein RvY_14330 [Ramazzottius varieornatus]
MAVLLVTLMQDGDPAFRFCMYICFAPAGAGIGFGLRSLTVALSHASSASGPKMARQRPEPIPNFDNASWSQIYALLSAAKKTVDVSILHLTDRRMVQILQYFNFVSAEWKFESR